jgi:hypothetical protein
MAQDITSMLLTSAVLGWVFGNLQILLNQGAE